MKWEEGRIGQEVLFEGSRGKIAVMDASDRTFYISFPTGSMWYHPADVEAIEAVDPEKYKPGEKGWIPDMMRSDIDVLAVTEELVSVEAGK